MTPSTLQPDHEKWQTYYSSSEARWQDLERMGAFLLPIVFLIFLATMYAVMGYTYVAIDKWTVENASWFSRSFYLLRIGLTIFAPLILTMIGLRVLFKKTTDFIVDFYQPKEDEKLSPLIQRRLLGVLPLPPPLNTTFKYPFLILKKPSLEDNHWARWFGGPATLVIYEGIAVYLERGNRFSRVVGPGFPMAFLERYERIKEIVNLKPQTRSGGVTAWTKDGIRIELAVHAECQINASPEAIASSKFLFPFDPLAVKTAVERMTVRLGPDGELCESSWLDGAWGTIIGSVISYVASHNLDELFLAPRANGHSSGSSSENYLKDDVAQILSHKIRVEELERIRKMLAQNGANVLSIQITNVEMPKEVLELRARYWETAKQRIAAVRNSRAEAERIRIREQAHAEAQRAMLNAITEKLGKVDPKDLTESLILSLSGIIDQSLDDPIIRPMIAKESFDVLNRVRKMLSDGF